MKYIISIFILLILVQLEVSAQKVATATMKVSATIISGVTLNNVVAINLDLEHESESNELLRLIAPKYIATDVSTESYTVVRNEFGDELTLSSSSLIESKNGMHSVDLSTKLDVSNNKNLRGRYYGNIITTINYL